MNGIRQCCAALETGSSTRKTRNWRGWLVLQAISIAAFIGGGAGLKAGDVERLRGDRVGWARLKTPSEHWRRHAGGDPTLMQFIRENTSLNIDPTWYVADSANLNELVKYPLLFSQGIDMIRNREARSNLAEYLRRGGFLLVDACCNRDVTADEATFLKQQQELLAIIMPEARVVSLSPDHAIFHCYFQIPNGRPPHTFYQNVYDATKARFGLYGIEVGSHLTGIISLSGLQCGWDKMIAPPGHDVACMRMLVNIYVYAMMQGN